MRLGKGFMFVVALLLMLSSAVFGQGNSLSFTITPMTDARFYRMPGIEYPVTYGVNFMFAVNAASGTVRFSIQDVDGGRAVPFGEFGGPSYSTPVELYGSVSDRWDAPSVICAENKQGNSWMGAETMCTTVYIMAGRGCLPLNENGEGCPSDFPDYGPLTYLPLEYWISGQTGQTETSVGPNGGSPGNTGPCSFTGLETGDIGRVTAGPSNKFRSQASTSATVYGMLVEYTQFTVISGPYDVDGLCWFEINVNGDTGYTAAGGENDRWIELVSKAPKAAPVGNTGSGNEDLVNLTIAYDGRWEHTYLFTVDPSTCLVTNGDEVVADEISRFSYWMDSTTVGRVGVYLATYLGDVDTFRRFLEKEIKGETGCKTFKYLIEGRTMDSSGLGNVAFGFFEYLFPEAWGEAVANFTQGLNPGSWWQFNDNDDDRTQRCVGREVGENAGFYVSINPAVVATAAVSCSLK